MIELLPFSTAVLPMVILLVVLLCLSALVSASETAFFSLNPVQISRLRGDKSQKSVTVMKLLDDQDSLLSTILLLNNLVNIAAILVANEIMNLLIKFNDAPILEFSVKVVAVTFMMLLFGEIMPKIFAAANNYAVSRFMSVPLYTMRAVLKPISYLLIKVGGVITNALSGNGQNVSMDQLQEAIEITKTETPEDKKMLSGIVRFVGTEVDEIMKPRIDVVAIDIESSFEKIKEIVVGSEYSRIPVYENSFDHVKGILFVKDLLPCLNESVDFEWQKLLRKPYFVPEHKKINDLLEDFQNKKVHLAIVVDEYGGTLGIVSLEDILEEIVGEISDESDIVHAPYQKLDDHNFIFDGKTHIGDCERILQLHDSYFDKVKGDADTLAGLMLELKGEFFQTNDFAEYRNLKFTAKEVENRRIIKVQVTIKD